MKEERIAPIIAISELIIILFLGFVISYGIDIISDKTNMIQELQKENNQCELQLDSIIQDYERLQNE